MPDPYALLTEDFQRQQSLTFDQVIQQADSRFKGMMDSETKWTGQEYIFRNISQNTWARSDTRGGTTIARESATSRRRMRKKKIEAEAIQFYEWDKEQLDSIMLPTGPEMTAMRSGYERGFDDLCIEAAYEDSMGGPEPYTTVQPFPASQKIAVDYNTPAAAPAGSKPMTSWKIFRAKKMFELLDIDLDREEVILAMSPNEEEDLLVEIQGAPNSVYAEMIASYYKSLNSGSSPHAKMLGLFTVVKTNRLPVVAGIRTCVAYCKSGLVKSAADEVKSSLDRIPQDKNKLLLQGSAMVGVARRYDEKFVWIPCYHA